METIIQLKRSIFILGCFLVYSVTVTCLGPLKPTAIDYDISRISQRQKQEFVDEHNKYRSSVDPPAANMEYMVRYLRFKLSIFIYQVRLVYNEYQNLKCVSMTTLK